jgi:CheY-like chemotaxis protein
MRFSKMAQSHPHRYVILCGGADLASVFPLCKQDYFDDYVLYWPQPHDGHRLVMAVWNAHRRLLAEQAQPSRAELASHAESAQALGAVVDRRLDEGLSHVQAVNASFAKVEQEVGKVRSQSTQVKSAMAASRETLAPMSEWAAGFRADVVPHVADAASLAKKVASQPTVFVVEDDAFAAKIICKSLEETFRVEVATEAKGLFGLLRRMRPAAILMDINLPGMDGLALTEWLKASPTFATIPVVMLTGEATRESIERSRTVGAADFIVKPFTREALLAKVGKYLPAAA